MSPVESRTIVVLERPDADLSEQVRAHVGPDDEILAAHDGARALQLVLEQRVAVVLVQHGLPGRELATLEPALLELTSPPSIVVVKEPEAELDEAARNAGYVIEPSDLGNALPMIVDHAVGTADLQALVATSEQQYRDLIEASNDAIYILSEGRFVYVNARFCELFGYPERELLQADFDYRRLVHAESLDLVEARVSGAQTGQPLPTRYEFRAKRKDDSAFDVEVSVSYITFDGRPSALGILQDITARKAYEKALLRKNHELSVLNAVAEAITQVNELSSVLDAIMERLIELLGVDAAGLSLLDDDDPGRFSSVHYRGCSETFIESMRHRAPHEGVLGLALEARELQRIDDLLQDPRVRRGAAVAEGFRSGVALPLINQERVFGVVNVFTRTPRHFSDDDVRLFKAVAHQLAVAIDNARLYREAQEGVRRLEALSEIARAIRSTLDVEGVFQIVGERLGPLVPFRRISLLIVRKSASAGFSVRIIDRPPPGEPPKVVLHTPMQVESKSPLRHALTQQAPIQLGPGTCEDRVLAPNPSCATIVVPIRADQSDMGLFVMALPEGARLRRRDLELLRDLAAHLAISLKNARMFQDLEAAYQELKDAKDQLVRSEKLHSLGEMAAGVAHDFNNVLSAILGRAQMMKVLLQDDEMQKSIRVIEKAALDGAGTVRRIQEFAKVRSDTAFVVVRLNPLVREVVERCATRIDAQASRVERHVALQEISAVLGNPSELREVLTNVIYNALDAMPHGGRLTVRTGSSEGGGAYIEVQDTGVGMEPEVANKIFDPFFTTKGERGTGLGMSVSYGIVQRHQGDLSVRSARGEGTTIRISLPPVPQGDVDPPVPRTPMHGVDLPWLDDVKTPPPVKPVDPTKTARILVIDDDVAVREVLADILRTGGHDVEVAGTGEEGVARFADGGFDVVFTDLGMPGMSGWEVAESIKGASPGTPVGLTTGWGATLDDSKLAEHGVDLVVPKPFRLEQVLDLVSEAVRLKERLG